MGLAVAAAVEPKLAVIDRDIAGRICSAEQAILVVMGITIIEGEIATLEADSGAVAVTYRRSRKFEVVDCDIATGDEDGFAVWNQTGRNQLDHPTGPLQG